MEFAAVAVLTQAKPRPVENVAKLLKECGAGDELEAPADPCGDDLARWSGSGDRGRDEHVCVQDDAHASLSTLGGPRPAHRVQLLICQLERRVGVECLAGFARLLFQRGGDAFAATGQLQEALVGEHDGLGAPARADHDRLGVGAGLTEALQQRGQLRAHLARGQHLMRLPSHRPNRSTHVYTLAITWRHDPPLHRPDMTESPGGLCARSA